MSTLKTHNLQSPDAASANIALTPNAGMVVTGFTTFTDHVKIDDGPVIENSATGSTLKITTPSGYIEVGPSNSSYSHFYTDRGRYYFNKKIVVDDGVFSSYNEDLVLATNAANDEHVFIKTDGKVGIGTNNPDQELTLWSNSPAIKLVDTDPYEEGAYGTIAQSGGVLQLVADSGNTSGHGSIFFYSYNDNDSFNTYRISDNLHQWYVSGEEKLRLSSTGNLGIGTVNPITRLDVLDTSGLGILSRSATTQATDTNKALKVRNNSSTDTFNVSYKGQGFFAGSVGIGTDDPEAAGPGIEIYSPNLDTQVRLRALDGVNKVHFDSRETNGGTYIYFTDSSATYNSFIHRSHSSNASFAGLRYCYNGSANEAIRISESGGFDMGGAGYGTAGQVLKSNGNAPPTWSGGAQRVLEVVASPCDGSTISSSNGDVTFQNVTGQQSLSTTFADVTGSKITYTPPTGTTQVIYEFNFQTSRLDALAIMQYRFYIAGTEVVYARSEIAGEDISARTNFKWVINIGGSANNNTGRLSSWTSGKELKLTAEDYGGSYDIQLHETNWWNGGGTDQFSMPQLCITAIGV